MSPITVRNASRWASAWDRKCSDLHAAWMHFFGTSTSTGLVGDSSIDCLRSIRAPSAIDIRMLGAVTDFLQSLEHTRWTPASARSGFAQEIAMFCPVSPDELLHWAGDHMIEAIDAQVNFDDVNGLKGLFYVSGLEWFEIILSASLPDGAPL